MINYELKKSFLLKKQDKEYLIEEGSVCFIFLENGEEDTVEILRVNNKSFLVGSYIFSKREPHLINYKDIKYIESVMEEGIELND